MVLFISQKHQNQDTADVSVDVSLVCCSGISCSGTASDDDPAASFPRLAKTAVPRFSMCRSSADQVPFQLIALFRPWTLGVICGNHDATFHHFVRHI